MARARLAAIAAVLLLPLLTLGLTRTRSAEPVRPFAADLPETLGAWRTLRDVPLDHDVEEMLSPEAYGMRLYAGDGVPEVWIYTAFYRGVAPIGAHDPEICYPAQGWTISDRRALQIDVGDGASFPAWFMRTQLGEAEELVLYWFQPARRWPRSTLPENLLRVADRLAGRPEYGFIRISLRRPLALRDTAAAEAAPLVAMASALAPWALNAVSEATRR